MDPHKANSGNPTDPNANAKPAFNPPPENVNSSPSLPWSTNQPQPPQAASLGIPYSPPGVQPSHSYPTSTVIENPNHTDPPPPPPITNEPSPVTITPPPSKKFPVMIATILIFLTITGFSGSYVYFRSYGKTSKKQIMAPLVTPPVREPQKEASGAASEGNPFDSGVTENPFSNEPVESNPFGEDETDVRDEPYQNPFDPPAGGTPTP